MRGISAVARDLKALGSSAPLRAAYEASKRTGFHSVLFRQPNKPISHRSRPLDFGTSTQVTEGAKARCLVDAQAILNEGLRVFGRRVSTGISAPWCRDPLTETEWPDDEPWWKIDIRSDDRLSDVKFVWEAARHRDLVILARAAAVDTAGPWHAELERLLHRWVEECPPEMGVNWYSSLELALRAIAWSQILGLAGLKMNPELRIRLDAQLVASARHIMLELPYTVSSMKNNHLLGDGLGLVVLGRMFPSHPWARRWQRIGDNLFRRQLARHMRADGSMIEDSLSYHRFVLEMLIVRSLVGGPDEGCLMALAGASAHLEQLGVLEGPVPQYGDWDEGRILTSSGDPAETAGSALLGLSLTGRPVPRRLWEMYDELAWYAPRPLTAAEENQPAKQGSGVSSGGGITKCHRGPWVVWFKTGGGPSHQHADLSSVWIQRNQRWLVSDPGTGTYNGPLTVRNGFRTSVAHPVWHPTGVDQFGPHRAFRWLHPTSGSMASATLELADKTVLFGWHDCFERLERPVTVGRALVVSDQYVLVVDRVVGAETGSQTWEMTVPLAPSSEGSAAQFPGANELFGLDQAVSVSGQENPFMGWHSETYGRWRPSTWLQLIADPGHLPIWGAGIQPAIVDGARTLVDGLEFDFEWHSNLAVLNVFDTQFGRSYEMRAARGGDR